ncbi:hypothetical protein CJF30_00011058 [Rutstroemia sp. NJR-2017a BBW]|nr:hypothetical protein CJF30_00011058 [Rutstroemia sp. NJR-2017a BBW]
MGARGPGQENGRSRPESIAARSRPEHRSLKLYHQLKKAESLVLFQARTGRIGLRRFLASAGVPGIESGDCLCLCGAGLETAEHTLLLLYRSTEKELGARGTVQATGLEAKFGGSSSQATDQEWQASLAAQLLYRVGEENGGKQGSR